MIETIREAVDSRLTNAARHERRRQARLQMPFPARVQGFDADGAAFDLEAKIDDVSAGGCYMRLPRRVARGTRLSATIRFTRDVPPAAARPMCLAVHGRVRRAELRRDGTCGVAVEFEHHLFL